MNQQGEGWNERLIRELFSEDELRGHFENPYKLHGDHRQIDIELHTKWLVFSCIKVQSSKGQQEE